MEQVKGKGRHRIMLSALMENVIEMRMYRTGLYISISYRNPKTSYLIVYEKTFEFTENSYEDILNLIKAYKNKYQNLIYIDTIDIPFELSTFKSSAKNNWPS